MKRNLITIAASLLFCSCAFAAEGSGLRRISEHVYAYAGATHASPASNFGANAGLVVGKDAALVVDTLMSAKAAARFLDDIRKVTNKPVRYVVDTHYHLDHAWGNSQFAKQGAVIIAQDAARAIRAKGTYSLSYALRYGVTAAELEGTVLRGADISFPDSLTVDLGGVTVELRYRGPTHTADSITAYVPADKVLFTGDILFSHYHPNITEGDLNHWEQVLTQLEKMPAEKIIPGHGPVSGKEDLKDMRMYLERFDALARSLCAGKQADDAPAIAREMFKRLPDQRRTELTMLVANNLRIRYLPQPKNTSGKDQ